MLSFVFFILYIVLFIGGMTIMRHGLINISQHRMRNWLLRFTSTPFKGFLFGVVITIIMQSSSAVMILTVGLISAGMLRFHQSIGIILGTNIGTTATLEFLAYGTDQMIIPFFILGSLCILFPYKRVQNFGLFFYGLGAIFLAMFGFEQLAKPLAASTLIGPTLQAMNETILFSVLVGCLITAIIQSSTAMTGIAMGFIETNVLSLPSAIAVMLGANIGTCVDALIASIGGGKEARLSAMAHIWLNVFGVLLFIPLIQYLAHVVASLSTMPETQLAHASVLFNVVVSLCVLPFSKQFARLIESIHGRKNFA